MKYTLLLIFTILCMATLKAFAETTESTEGQLTNLEKSFDGKIGVYAIDTNSNQVLAHRAMERFPFQSTSKLLVASALLKQSEHNKKLFGEKIHYTKNELDYWYPVTGQHLKDGMTLEALAEAAISYSDDPAMNFLMKRLGGPTAITSFARSIGNKTFTISHYEPNLNSDPKNPEDTSTPKDMAISAQNLTLGNTLSTLQQNQLVAWMRNNTTGYKRMRSGVQIGWIVADKTGSGDFGIANDIGIIWSPACKPIVIAIYTVQNNKAAKGRDDVVADTTNIIVNAFAKNDACFKALFS